LKINIGVLGGSSFAERSLIPAINELSDNFEILGIASRDEKKAERLAKKFNTNGYNNYNDLLNNSELQAIYIPLPNSLHYKWIKESIGKGLHVLVEKSLSCSFSEVEELTNLASEKNLALVENFQFRFHSQLDFIKTLVKDGKIGELRCIRSSFGFPPFPDKNNIRYKKELGGGALLDCGAYPIKIAQEFLGKELFVKASNLHFDKDLEVDIWGGAYLEQVNGDLFAQIAFGFDNYYQCNIELWGSEGKIYTNRIFTAPINYKPTVKLETKDGVEEVELKEDNAYKNMLLNFYAVTLNIEEREKEYKSNLVQAKLLSELFSKASTK
jgi:predicted dehydrogenase